MIHVSHVVKRYGKKQNDFLALNDVSFDVKDGETLAIIGKSGSGKSTLMHVMSGLDHPSEGAILVDGKNLKAMKPKERDQFRSRSMSFIFQSFFVQGNETCYDNVALPLEIARIPRRNRKALVEKALKAVELGEKIKSRAKDLSGGQKQRLAIARAIVNEPTILFADEPTGNLDSATGAVIERLLFDYAAERKAILVVVTHDEDLARKCSHQIYLKDGRIVKQTSSVDTLRDRALKLKKPLGPIVGSQRKVML